MISRISRWAGVVAAVAVAGGCATAKVQPSGPRLLPSPVTIRGAGAQPPPPSAPGTRPVAPTVTAAAAVPTASPHLDDLLASVPATEAAIHASKTPLEAVPALGAIEQEDAAALADHPDWMAAVLATVPPDLRTILEATVRADRDLAAIPGPVPDRIPAWRIVHPMAPAALITAYQAASAATGVPWEILAAIHLVESRMGRIQGPSGAGAQGPMQFMPGTWAAYGNGGDIGSDRDAIAAAARFLRASGAPGDLAGALLHYNHSQSYVDAVLAYASAMHADERTFYGYYGWRVYVRTTAGTFLLPEGYGA